MYSPISFSSPSEHSAPSVQCHKQNVCNSFLEKKYLLVDQELTDVPVVEVNDVTAFEHDRLIVKKFLNLLA